MKKIKNNKTAYRWFLYSLIPLGIGSFFVIFAICGAVVQKWEVFGILMGFFGLGLFISLISLSISIYYSRISYKYVQDAKVVNLNVWCDGRYTHISYDVEVDIDGVTKVVTTNKVKTVFYYDSISSNEVIGTYVKVGMIPNAQYEDDWIVL